MVGTKDFTAPYISIDLSEGGKFLYAMRGAGFDGKVKDWWNARYTLRNRAHGKNRGKDEFL